jgi:hypothetical protein
MEQKAPQYKGTNLLHTRKRLLAAGGEEQFCRSLSPEDLAVYRSAINAGWYPVENVSRIFTAAVKILYPQDAHPLRALGKDQALDNLNGIYKVILHIVDAGVAIQQSALFWKTHFSRGDAQGVKEGTSADSRQLGVLIVKNFPELPAPFLDIVEGYILGVVEFTRRQILDSKHDAKDPMAWRWIYGYR